MRDESSEWEWEWEWGARGVDVERVGGARVLEVVDQRGEQRREDLELREPILQIDGSHNI